MNQTDLSKLIKEACKLPEEEKVEENGKIIASEIENGGLMLVDLVEELGSKLTSTEVKDRVVGMNLLGQVLATLKSDFLRSDELTFIVEFLHDRLKDQQLVFPKVLFAILPVIKCTNLPVGSSSKLLRQLFSEANIQSNTQRHRRIFFLIIQHLLRNNLNEVMELGSDFVLNFLQSMDGEKDPRNLLILFNLIPSIISNFPLEPFTEDFFEVLSMYFPIDFNPSLGGGQESEVITREDLAEALHMCLSQTNQFAEYLVPLALEKLESSVLDAKLDSLSLLGMCCERSYTAEDLNPHLPSIWHAMRREIFMGGDETVERASNAVICSVFRRLSENNNILETNVKMVFAECKHHLSEPELRLSQPASKILLSAAQGNETTCGRVISMTLPLLYEQFTVKTSNPERRGILGIMITFISVIHQFPTVRLSLVVDNWDEILWLWFSLLTHSHQEFVLLSLTAFLTLLKNRKQIKGQTDLELDFNEKNRDLLQAHLLSILFKEDDDMLPDIRSRVISTMRELALSFPEDFLKTSVPKLLDYIRLENLSASDEDEIMISEDKMKGILSSLVAVSLSLPVLKVILPSLVKVLVELKERREDYEAVVGCLSTIVKEASISQDVEGFVELASVHLTEIITVGIDARSKGKTTLYDQLVGIIRTIIQVSDISRQQNLINSFWNDRVAAINLVDLARMNVIPGLLGEGILGSVRPSINIDKKEELMKLLLEKVFSNSLDGEENEEFEIFRKEGCEEDLKETPNDLDSLANIRLYSTFLNKSSEEEFSILLIELERLFREKLQTSQDDMEVCVGGDRVSPAQEALGMDESIRKLKSVVTFFIWTVKALAMRGFSGLDFWIKEKMIRMITDLSYGQMVADGFSIMMTDSLESLNANSFCNYKFLYKQRIFQLSVPNLVRGYKEAKTEIKANYIRALTGQLRHVPPVVLQMELNNVVPLLVGSLEYELPSEDEKDEVIISRNKPDAPLLISSLTALLELLTPSGSSNTNEATVSTLLDYFMDLAPRLVRLSQYKGFMQVRILALKCLQQCAKFSTHVILPLKEQIVRDLRISLDDPKRIVRKAAVRTKSIWTLIGAPGGL